MQIAPFKKLKKNQRLAKFEKSIKDRQDFKKKFMNTQKLTILNSNDNLKKTYDPEQTLKGSYTGG